MSINSCVVRAIVTDLILILLALLALMITYQL
jgi:hypothetical protein